MLPLTAMKGHLRSKTRGEANQIVKRFDLVDENFNLAWKPLANIFDNSRFLAQKKKKKFGIEGVLTECSTERVSDLRKQASRINQLSKIQSFHAQSQSKSR